MEKYFVDANIFLRFLTNDIPDKATKVEKLIERALSNEIILGTNTVVFCEIIWTLDSFYKYDKKIINEIVSPLVASKAFQIPERAILLQALESFHTLNIDFADAYMGAWMQQQGVGKIYTFNEKHFKRIPNIKVCKF